MTDEISLRILDTPEDMYQVEALQRIVWPGEEIEIVPASLLLTAAHNGGLTIGAYTHPAQDAELVGFAFGFPGLEAAPDGPRLKHCSHMLGVHPDYRNAGIGFKLKRAQWQMVRHQGLERITWTFDPLLSRNAHLNITLLGAVSSTYLIDAYGPLRDSLNAGLPTDRLQVDWWLNSRRVLRRMGEAVRKPLDLAHYLDAGTPILNPTRLDDAGLPHPSGETQPDAWPAGLAVPDAARQPLLLLEIPSQFGRLRKTAPALAIAWRLHIRSLLQTLFAQDYLITDFVYLPGATPRSFYLLSHGEAELQAIHKND